MKNHQDHAEQAVRCIDAAIGNLHFARKMMLPLLEKKQFGRARVTVLSNMHGRSIMQSTIDCLDAAASCRVREKRLAKLRKSGNDVMADFLEQQARRTP